MPDILAHPDMLKFAYDPSRHARSHRPGRSSPARRRPRRISDRNRLRPRRRRHQRAARSPRVFAAKGRPSFNPLIVHVARVEAVSALAHVTPTGATLAAAFWPGALTLVLPRRSNRIVAELATAGLDTIAVRVPAHPDRPGPAAGSRTCPSPRPAPTAPAMSVRPPRRTSKPISATESPMILDGGATPVGLESTVVDVTGEDACHPAPRRHRARGHRTRRSGLPSLVAGDETVNAVLARHAGAPLRARHAGSGSTRATCARARRCWRSAAMRLHTTAR